MASEIKVDTISEKTSAGGVTIDGLLIKDGNISGDVALAGTTPTFTIGDAGAEDATLLFDGNAQDFYIALDDSADDLLIGLGSTVGTTPMLSFTEGKAASFAGAVTMASTLDVTTVATAATFEPDGDTAAGDNAAIGYTSGEGLILTGQGSTSDVTLKNDADGTVFTVPTGTDDILFPDSAKAMWGAGSDMLLYHDGSNSYITNAVGALKIATETSGIALTIGHTTSETTVADNLTVTGTATITGGLVVFPATNVATTNANTLDDYQEGTWTPAFASSGATITNGSTNGGHYTKIGRQCFFQGSVGTGGSMSGGTAANGVTVSLPLTSAGHQTGESGYNTVQIKPWLSVYTWGGDTPTLGRVNTSAAYFTLYYQDSVDSYMIPLRFDDLADDVNSPRNLTYFSGMFTVEA